MRKFSLARLVENTIGHLKLILISVEPKRVWMPRKELGDENSVVVQSQSMKDLKIRNISFYDTQTAKSKCILLD